MSITKGKLRRSAVVVAFSLGAFQALSIVGANVASAVGTCSVSAGVMTVAAPNPGDDMTIAVDTNGNIHVAAAAAPNAVPNMVTQQVPTCNGGSGGLATVTTINITGDSGPTTNNQTVIINMAVIDAVTFLDTTTRANWGTVNWTVNLGSNGPEGDSLVILNAANTTLGNNITGGVNGFDLNSDGDLDISPVVGVEKVYIDSNSNGENTVNLNGSTITGAAFAQGAWIGNSPTAPLNQPVLTQTLTSFMATDTGDNTLSGGAGQDVIVGGLADDTIAPGLGSDRVTCSASTSVDLGGFFGDNQPTLDYSNTTTAINANLPINTVTQGADLDSVSATCLDVIGTTAADTLTGGVGSNWFRPGAGDDHVSGGPAGDNFDTYDVADATDAVTVDLIAGTSTGGSGTDALTEIENVVGGAGNDVITGENGAAGNTLRGGGGNDTLSGGVGDDLDGPDTFVGGSGIDTIDYSANTLSTNVALNGAAACVTVPGVCSILNGVAGEADRISSDSIENAILGTGNDSFSGSSFNNIVWPNGGQNTLNGCPLVLLASCGIDTVNYSQGYTAGVTINLSGGGGTGGASDSIAGFENAVGTDFNDTMFGTDVVGGTNGANLLVGGKGNDNISANAGPDLVRAGAGNDIVRGGAGDDTLKGQGGKDNIRGSGGADDIFGGKGSDYCNGGAGNDLLKTCEKPRHHGHGPNGPGLHQRV